MLISKRSFLNLTRSKIGIIRIWDKRRTEGVEKSASRITRAARFCSRRMRSKSVFEQFLLTCYPKQHHNSQILVELNELYIVSNVERGTNCLTCRRSEILEHMVLEILSI